MDLFADPHRLRGDLRLAGRALRQGWPLHASTTAEWLRRLRTLDADRLNQRERDGVARLLSRLGHKGAA